MAKLDEGARVMLANVVADAGGDINRVRDLVKTQIRGTKDLARLRYLTRVLRVEAGAIIRRRERSAKRRLEKAVPIAKVLPEIPFVFTHAMLRDARDHERDLISGIPESDL